MVVAEAIRRRAVAAMRPWLSDSSLEPELDIRVGVLLSRLIAKNLSLNPVALNTLLDSSVCVYFENFTVGEIELQFRPWSMPAVLAVVKDVDITLALREMAVKQPHYKHLRGEERKRLIASLDPLGAVLHEMIQSLAVRSPKNMLSSMISNAVLVCSDVLFQSIHVKVNCIDELHCVFLSTDDLHIKPERNLHSSFLGGLIYSGLSSQRKSRFAINCDVLSCSLKDKAIAKCEISFMDLNTCFRLESHKITSLGIQIDHTDLKIFPEVIPSSMVIMDIVHPRSQNAVRSGRYLWSMLSEKLRRTTLGRITSLHEIFRLAVLWQRYVRMYIVLLSSLGFPSEKAVTEKCARLSNSCKFTSAVRRQWEIIVDLEEKIPAEAVARARVVARGHVLSPPPSSDRKSLIILLVDLLMKFFSLILLVWRFIWEFLFAKRELDAQAGPCSFADLLCRISNNSDPIFSFGLYCAEMSFSLFPFSDSQMRESSATLVVRGSSFFLSDSCVEKSLILVTGEVNLSLSFPSKLFLAEIWQHTGRGRNKPSDSEDANEVRVVLLSEPAKFDLCSDKHISSSSFEYGEANSSLENNLEKLKSKWMEISHCYEELGMDHVSDALLVAGYACSLTNLSLTNVHCGLKQFSVVLGRLIFDLDYSSMLFIHMLARMVQHYSNFRGMRGCREILNAGSQPEVGMQDIFIKWKLAMLNFVPKSDLQVGILVTGPCIRMKLHGDELAFRSDVRHMSNFPWKDRCVVLDFANTEVLVSPSCKLPKGICQWPSEVPTLSEVKDASYCSRGRVLNCFSMRFTALSVSVVDAVANQKSCVVGPLSFKLDLSTCWEYLHLFSGTQSILSIALGGNIMGVVAHFDIDDLFSWIHGWKSMYVICAAMHRELDFVDCRYSGDFISRWTTIAEQEAQNYVIQSNTDTVPDVVLMAESTHVVLKAVICMEEMDVIIDSLRGGAGATSSSKSGSESLPTSDTGISFCIPALSVNVSSNEQEADITVHIAGVQSVLFNSGISQLQRVESMLTNNLHKFSVSKGMLRIRVGHPSDYARRDSGASPRCENETEISCIPITGFIVDIVLGEVIVADVDLHSFVTEHFRSSDLRTTITVSHDIQLIRCSVQDGLVFLETSALAKFFRYFSIYALLLEKNSVSVFSSSEISSVGAEARFNGREDLTISEVPSSNLQRSWASRWDFIRDFHIDMSNISLTFAAVPVTGVIRNVTLRVDMSGQASDFGKAILFKISCLSIVAGNLYENLPAISRESAIPHFRPESLHAFSVHNGAHEGGDGPSSFQGFMPKVEQGNMNARFSYSESHILKRLSSLVKIQKTAGRLRNLSECKSCWSGSGSISGFNITLTISNIQILSMLFTPMEGMLASAQVKKVTQNAEAANRESSHNLDPRIPDGAIVALLDLHRRLYIAVEAVGNKHRVVGTHHYSLVGKRSLFRVKYHKRWRSELPDISFAPLHANEIEVRAACLNFSPGLNSVEVSGKIDDVCSLWKLLPFRPDAENPDDNRWSFKVLPRYAFHLVNRKNNRAVAFIDGFPEFVSKPGNLFKVKVFGESDLSNSISHNPVVENSEQSTSSGHHHESSHAEEDEEESNIEFPSIDVTIDKMSLTVMHEASNLLVPLVQGCANEVHVITQLLSSKVRVLTSFNVSGQFFDARRNKWNELVYPVASFMFFRSRYAEDLMCDVGRIPVRAFFNMEEVNVKLTELSVDILLYLAGELDIITPYTVRSSAIFPNSCKVENLSGLTLSCHFYNDEETIIPSKRCATVFLRHLMLDGELPLDKSPAAISLVRQGEFSTSPINVNLSDSRAFAWRTRVTSLTGSKGNFPGPLLVVEVSKQSEEGLCLAVSPLIRIHNMSNFTLDLQFRRSQDSSSEQAFVTLRSGETIDDSMGVFDAISLSGGSKRALMSLALGNFLLSLRPKIFEHSDTHGESSTIEWSEDLTSAKAIHFSGLLEKLNYKLRTVLDVHPTKSSFSSLRCPIFLENRHVSNLYFLVHTLQRDVPLQPPEGSHVPDRIRSSSLSLHVQREIFIYPTIQVHNLLQCDILVTVSENQKDVNMGTEENIPRGSTTNFYVNPEKIFFSIMLIEYKSKSKPIYSGDWVKKLQKQKTPARHLDLEIEFEAGKYFVNLRLSREDKGILEVVIFTKYMLRNDSELSLICTSSPQRISTRLGSVNPSTPENSCTGVQPAHGCLLPPNSSCSWFLKSAKVHIRSNDRAVSEASIDIDALSGFAEFGLEIHDDTGSSRVATMGVSLQSSALGFSVPTQIVVIVPRYILCNESTDMICIRQYGTEDTMDFTNIEAKQRIMIPVRKLERMRMATSFWDTLVKTHANSTKDLETSIQFRPKESCYSWSGPVCIASLGHFFLKFRPINDCVGESTSMAPRKVSSKKFATVNITEESSSLVLHFFMPANVPLPYRIENCLVQASIMYFQKDSTESDMLEPGDSVEYIWDSFSLPHKLVVQVIDMHVSREINIDKVCAWKPFLKMSDARRLAMSLPTSSGSSKHKLDKSYGMKVSRLGYEVYTDGLSRILRICECPDVRMIEKIDGANTNVLFTVSYFFMHLIDTRRENIGEPISLSSSSIVAMQISHIYFDSVVTGRDKYLSLTVQSINLDEKWEGASFGSILRMNRSQDGSGDAILHVSTVVSITKTEVKQVKFFSMVLQPIDLKVDEETLMRVVPFWRSSLGNSGVESTKYYFRHFEVHPIKIFASFRPGSSTTTYSSAQEALRSLLHTVVKVPAVNNTVVELNGILLKHALVTSSELLLKCAQHYSWYLLRAIYVAKGSSLLPPTFVAIFDDTALSSLDVFFDPSDGSINLPGFTVGMFKFISKSIQSKDLSGTRRYLGDLGKTIRTAGSKALFAATTEVSDCILRGAEMNGINGMVNGFHQGVLRLAMEPSLLGLAVMEGGPDRKIKLDRSAGLDEMYVEGYLQAMLDVMYKQEYLRIRVVDDEVILKNLPPSTSVINDIVENVKGVLVSHSLLKGDALTASRRPARHLRGENDWRLGPTVLTLCEHLFVGFAIRFLRNHADRALPRVLGWIGWRQQHEIGDGGGSNMSTGGQKTPSGRLWAVGRFVMSGLVAYLDGRLCRNIPNPILRRIVSGFLLSFLDQKGEATAPTS